MGEIETTKKKVDVKARIEEAHKIASEVALRISNEPNDQFQHLSAAKIIPNDRGAVCMDCFQKANYKVTMSMCPCYAAAANPSPKIPKRFPNPCLVYLFLPTGQRKVTSANALYKLFSDYGTVTKVEIPTASKHGLVTFENVDDAERALDALNEQGHFVEWLDWFDAVFDYKLNVIKSGSSTSNTSSSQG
ncbi:hypothetical protein OROMI_020086 [Orobanche minor]